MTKLFQLLHEFVEHAIPAGNKRAEFHELVDQAAAEHEQTHAEPAPAEAPAAEHHAEPAKPVLRAKPDGAAVA